MAVQGLVAVAAVEHAAIADGLLTDPLVLEAAFQAAGLHRMVMNGMMGLPSEIDAVARFREVGDHQGLVITLYQRGDCYDVDVDDDQGQVLKLRGFRLIDRGPLPADQQFPPPEGGWVSVALAAASERGALPEAEQKVYGGRGTARRQADRLAGQLAGRRAIHPLGGTLLERLSSGAPIAEPAHIGVSLSHQDGQALAVAMQMQQVGVDIEQVEPRPQAFVEEWFAPEEWPLLVDDGACARAWAVKEAVLKALGVGMAVSPREVRVVSLVEPSVRLVGEAARRHRELGGAPLRVRTGQWGKRVVALAHFRR